MEASATVDAASEASLVPESAGPLHCTVAACHLVVVSVIRGEHHVVVVTESIPYVTRKSGNQQPVVVSVTEHNERTVLGPVPAAVEKLQVKSQLIAVVLRQLTEQVVAEPVVASRVIEPDLELLPRTIEGIGPVDMLLDQQRKAIGCTVIESINQSIKQMNSK